MASSSEDLPGLYGAGRLFSSSILDQFSEIDRWKGMSTHPFGASLRRAVGNHHIISKPADITYLVTAPSESNSHRADSATIQTLCDQESFPVR
jgi:hypothetical protein